MKMKTIISALLVSAALSTPAFAEGFMDGVVGTKYVVVDAGSIGYGGSGTALSLSVGGGYQIHPAVAVEVDYLHGGSMGWGSYPGYPGWSASLDSLQAMGVGHYTINDSLVAYAKAGVALNSYKYSYPFFYVVGGTGYWGQTSSTTTSNNLTAAIGIKYNINQVVALHAQYQDFGTQSVSVVSIGAQFSF